MDRTETNLALPRPPALEVGRKKFCRARAQLPGILTASRRLRVTGTMEAKSVHPPDRGEVLVRLARGGEDPVRFLYVTATGSMDDHWMTVTIGAMNTGRGL